MSSLGGLLSTLPGVLKCLETQQVPSVEFPSAVTAIALCGAAVLVGLETGEVSLVCFLPTPHSVLLHSLHPHTCPVRCLAACADEKRCLSACDSLKIWDIATQSELATFEKHEAMVHCIALAGDFCMSGAADGSLHLWQTTEIREVMSLIGHSEGVSFVVLSSDGKQSVSAAGKTVKLWAVNEQREIAAFAGHSGEVTCIALTCDDRICVSASADKTVRLYSLENAQEIATLIGHSGAVTCLAVTPDSRLCLSGSDDSTIRVWSLDRPRHVATLAGHNSFVKSLSVTRDSKYLVSASWDFTLKLWSLEEFRKVVTFRGHSSRVGNSVVSRDGKFVVSAAEDRVVKLWTLAKRREAPIYAHEDVVRCLAVTRDGRFCVSGGQDNVLKVWNCDTQDFTATLRGHSGWVTCLALSADSQYCVSAARDSTLKVWSFANAKETATFQGSSGGFWAVALTDDGRYCVSASEDSGLKVWSMRDFTEAATLLGHTDVVYCVALTADSKSCISGSKDKTIKQWSLGSFRDTGTLVGHTDLVRCVAVTADATLCASGSYDKTVRLWNLRDMREIATLRGHTEYVQCLTLTRDDRFCLSGSDDKCIIVWDIAARRRVATFQGHSGDISGLAVTAGGHICVSGSLDDSSLVVWSMEQLRKCAVLAGHRAEIKCVAVVPGDKYCISGAKDGSVRVDRLCLPWDGADMTEATPYELILNIQHFRDGVSRSKAAAMPCFPSHGFNSLHISAYFNHAERCQEYLSVGVPIIRGAFGSPLTVALERKAIKCVDAMLRYLIDLVASSPGDSSWPIFRLINEDILALLGCSSSLLVPFFCVLMQTPDHPLPQFITPCSALPQIAHFPIQFISISDFDQQTEDDKLLVKFQISLIRWNFAVGSQKSIHLLEALSNCSEKLVLKSQFVSTIIHEKWQKFYPLTLGMTLGYTVMLVTFVMIVFNLGRVEVVIGIFLALNTVFLMYEGLQMVTMKVRYFADSWNYVDVLRGTLCVVWGVPLLRASEPGKYLTLAVSILSFLRGFTYFRSFTMTRIFVDMTLAVVKDMYSFLFILAYSVFAFGMFSAILSRNLSLSGSWTIAFNMIMGEFDDSKFDAVEWAVFMSASVTNVIIMLNLLISILGEAYEKSQMSLRENDLHQQLNLIVEYESLMFWRWKSGSITVMVTCEEAKGGTDEWQGKILQITSMMQKDSRSLEKKIENLDSRLGVMNDRVQEKFAMVEGTLTIMGRQLTGVEQALQRNSLGQFLTLEQKFASVEDKVAGFEAKMTQMQSDLHAILAHLQSH